jgi:Leucine-rich repeat (LRR) protein
VIVALEDELGCELSIVDYTDERGNPVTSISYFVDLPDNAISINNGRVVYLSLTENITSLEAIGNFHHLEALKLLDIHSLKDLTFIKNLSMLEILQIQGTSISDIPESISNCGELKYLWLSHNQIKEIPSSLSELINLEELDLSNNNISVFPEFIPDLKSLKGIKISNNRFNVDSPNFKVILKKLEEKKVHLLL